MVKLMNNMFHERVKSHHLGMESMKYMTGMCDFKSILSKPCDRDKNVIYIHIPFCKKICSFCNMRRSLSECDPLYADLVIKNMEAISKTDFIKSCEIDAVYFGGGTPTSMDTPSLKKILKGLNENFNLIEDCEITMETTLSELPQEKLKAILESGVNRISAGVQTFSDRGRRVLGRLGDKEFTVRRINEYLETGLKNVNIDIIYNYPEETEEELLNDLKHVKNLDIAGFSMYSLIITEGSTLGKIRKPDILDKRSALERDYRFFKTITENMRAKGFDFLELTKMVRKNRDEYRYIRGRNNGKYTIPLGAGAGGRIGNALIMNPFKIDEYKKFIENIYEQKFPVLKKDFFDIDKAISKLQFLNISPIEFPIKNREQVIRYLKDLKDEGLFTENNGNYRLTDEGIFFGNSISKGIWDLIGKTDSKEASFMHGHPHNNKHKMA